MWTSWLFFLTALVNANDGEGSSAGDTTGCDLCNGTPLNADLTFMWQGEEQNCGEWINQCGADPTLCGSECIPLTSFATYETPCCGDPPEDCGGPCPDRMVFNAFHVFYDSWGLPSTCGGTQWWCERNMENCGGCEGYKSWLQSNSCCTAEKKPCEDCISNFYNNGGCDVLYPQNGGSTSNVDVTTLMDRDCRDCFHHGKKYCVAETTWSDEASLCDWSPWMDTVSTWETTNPKAYMACERFSGWNSDDSITCTCVAGFTPEQVAADSAIGTAMACWYPATDNWPDDIKIEMIDVLYANCKSKGTRILSDDMDYEEYKGVCGKSGDERQCKQCAGKWKKRKCYLKSKAKKVKCSKLNAIMCEVVGKCYMKNGKCKGGKAFA